jgi:PAS domain S-box-containing protein
MPSESGSSAEYRVLVVAPTRRDEDAICDLLRRAHITALSCAGALALSKAIEEGAGAILLTDAIASDTHVDHLLIALSRQPAWSDIPTVMLCHAGVHSPLGVRVLEALRNVTVLERPSSSRTLISSVQAALRARGRQYQLREQFEALRSSEGALRDSEERFRTMINSIPQLAWMARADGSIHWFNQRWYDYTGSTPADMENEGWRRMHRPETMAAVLEKWNAALASGLQFEMEFPLRSADGHFRRFLTRVVPLKNEQGVVQQWFGTNTDIEEAKLTEEQLRATEASLRDADHRKDLFLATLAHELRNPLAPIRNAAQILSSPNLTDEQLSWVQTVIQRQAKHMALLLDDLLDVARITQDKLHLKIERVTLSSIVEAAVEAARPLIEKKQHELTVTMPHSTPLLDGDPVRLSQVVLNLLTNAAKYTDSGGQIKVRCEADGTLVRISVRDNGIGIARDAMPKIFLMFAQIDESMTRSEDGLGIGLSLVKGIAELHGGRVEVNSDGPGCGSEFTIYLPQAGTQAALSATA